MTAKEQKLADDFMRAQIAKLYEETAKMQKSINDEKISAEITKLLAETAKINSENRWYIAVVASGATLAIVAIVKLFM